MKIQTKLIFGLIIGSLALISSAFFAMQWSFSAGLMDYVSKRELAQKEKLVSALAQFYARNHTWEPLVEQRDLWSQILRQAAGEQDQNPTFGDRRPPRPPHGRPPPRHEGGAPPDGRRPPPGEPPPREPRHPTLMDAQKQPVIGEYHDKYLTVPIALDGTTVGWLAMPPKKELTEAVDIAFRANQNLVFLVVAGVLSLSSICFSFPLARHFLKPLSKLGQATHALAQGHYDVELDHRRRDELGTLAEDFRTLAETLKNNEGMRKRWIADISHELRTPLAIIKGEIEAMQDGIRPLSQENLSSLHQEVRHLEKLIQDLFELSNAELGALKYQKSQLDLREILQDSIDKHDRQFQCKDFVVNCIVPSLAVPVYGDETRLTQLIDNLLGNTVKYAEDRAQIMITLAGDDHRAELTIEDSGPGVPPEALPYLFDHLYRVEHSRNRALGGAGIGLAICKKIVDAHNGTIRASQSTQGGLAVTLQIPLSR